MDGREIQRMRQEAWKQVRQEYKDDSECCFAFGFEAGYRFAVAPRVEPPVTESGEGFESLPAKPQQPKALRLADTIDREWRDNALNYDTAQEAAAELRSLHAIKQDLLGALREILDCDNTKTSFGAVMRARSAIDKAKGGAA